MLRLLGGVGGLNIAVYHPAAITPNKMKKQTKEQTIDRAKRQFRLAIADVMKGCKYIKEIWRFNYSVGFVDGNCEGGSWEASERYNPKKKAPHNPLKQATGLSDKGAGAKQDE